MTKFVHIIHVFTYSEPHKARRCFVSASEGIATETFLTQKLLQGHDGSHQQLMIAYYLKVISQFEEYSMPDQVISLANEAICLADGNDPNVVSCVAVTGMLAVVLWCEMISTWQVVWQ